jgi:hypothetical protein
MSHTVLKAHVVHSGSPALAAFRLGKTPDILLVYGSMICTLSLSFLHNFVIVSTFAGAEGRQLLQECTGNTLLDALYRENPQFATLVKEMGEPPVRRHCAAVEIHLLHSLVSL